MTALTAARAEALADGIQPFDARLHLRQVAELIAAVFANELDANGRSAVQDKESIGRWSPLLGTILSTAFFTDYMAGYVWVQDGLVVGNVTVQRQENSDTRWRISNVAVATGYRGRGIARRLMQATLREIARRGGSWAVLQVRVDNPTARHLYEKLGFGDVCRDGLWFAATVPSLPLADPDGAGPPASAAFRLQPLVAVDWRARLDLAEASRSPLAHWAEELAPAGYRPGFIGLLRQAIGELTGLVRVRRWGLWDPEHAGVLLADVEAIANSMGEPHHLCLAARPAAPAAAIAALLGQGLGTLAALPRRGVLAEYSGEMAAPGRLLEANGFRPRRVLLTMRRFVTPADATMPVLGLD
jgi:ribosomal protein S18 acetylase RimI-like enzyme